MQFLIDNLIALLAVAACLGMHLFGHGHGKHPQAHGASGDDRSRSTERTRS